MFLVQHLMKADYNPLEVMEELLTHKALVYNAINNDII